MTYTTDLDGFVELLKTAATTLVPATLKRVYYGDPKLIPDYPAALVIPGSKDRPVPGGGSRFFQVVLTAQVVIIHERIDSIEVIDKVVTQRAADVEAALMADKTLGNAIIFGFVNRITPVVVMREKVMHRAHQLTYTGESREYF